MRPENWLRRRIKPVAKGLGISGPVNFHEMLDPLKVYGAGDGDRTRDIQLGKLAFYR